MSGLNAIKKIRLNQQFGDLILFKQWNKLTKSIKYHNFDAEYIVQTVESPFWWLSQKLKLEINDADNIRNRSFNDDVESTARQKIKQRDNSR